MEVCTTKIQTIEGGCDKDVSPKEGDHTKKIQIRTTYFKSQPSVSDVIVIIICVLIVIDHQGKTWEDGLVK